MLGDPDRARSFSNSRRTKRFTELVRRFPNLTEMRVLDLGGTPDFWRSMPVQPRHVVTMNLDSKYSPVENWLEHIVADACRVDSLERCRGGFDLVVSNSLIEHVGGYLRRVDLARVIEAAAPSHWVQTPDRYFPIEPHYLGPGFQFVPPRARAEVVRRWPVAHERVHTTPEALEQVFTIELITSCELQHLFPGSTLWHERLLGISKSIVAVKVA